MIKELEVLSKEHAELFPLATLDGQFSHLDEELKEVKDVYKKYYTSLSDEDHMHFFEECADVFIVCAGIYRFRPLTAEMIVYGLFTTIKLVKYPDFDFYYFVDKKWCKNKKRTWEYIGDGNYKHIAEAA